MDPFSIALIIVLGLGTLSGWVGFIVAQVQRKIDMQKVEQTDYTSGIRDISVVFRNLAPISRFSFFKNLESLYKKTKQNQRGTVVQTLTVNERMVTAFIPKNTFKFDRMVGKKTVKYTAKIIKSRQQIIGVTFQSPAVGSKDFRNTLREELDVIIKEMLQLIDLKKNC